jgi:hypothetical protein
MLEQGQFDVDGLSFRFKAHLEQLHFFQSLLKA